MIDPSATKGGVMAHEENLDGLRKLVMAKRIERGGGIIPEDVQDAAKAIGISHVQLGKFLKREGGISAESAIRLAAYLNLPDYPTSAIVRMAGYPDVATIIAAHELPSNRKNKKTARRS